MNSFVKKLLLRSPLAALLVVLVAAAPAAAEPVIPPENSAANQYTESFPTGGGDRNAYAEGDEISPGKVLGKRNAEKLDEKGPEGRAVAELAAETAPVPVPEPSESEDSSDDGDGQAAGGGNGGGNGNGGGAQPANPTTPDTENPPTLESTTVLAADTSVEGDSGLGQVLGQAFGTSSGGMGLLLPFLLIGIAIWAFAFASRNRQRPAE